MYQGTKSAILLETNGKMSIPKRTKHIKVRFFFIKYAISRGDMSMDYFPTDKMWADILTKPLKVNAFKEMRYMLMEFPVDYV